MYIAIELNHNLQVVQGTRYSLHTIWDARPWNITIAYQYFYSGKGFIFLTWQTEKCHQIQAHFTCLNFRDKTLSVLIND